VEVKERMRQEMYALLTAPSAAPATKQQLRRKRDRIQLEAALGFDTELIESVRP
jgi:hypothetical protein